VTFKLAQMSVAKSRLSVPVQGLIFPCRMFFFQRGQETVDKILLVIWI